MPVPGLKTARELPAVQVMNICLYLTIQSKAFIIIANPVNSHTSN